MTAGLTLLRNAFFSGSTPVLPGDVVRTTTPVTNFAGNAIANVVLDDSNTFPAEMVRTDTAVTDFNGNMITNVVMDGGLMQDMKLPVINFSAASFDVSVADSGAVYTSSLNGNVNFNIVAGLPKGWNCVVVQLGTDTLSFTTDVGVTIVHRNGHDRLAGQYAVASLIVLNDAGTIVSLSGDTKA